MTEHYVRYHVAKQIMITAFLDKQISRKMDWVRLMEQIQIDYKTRKLWDEIHDMCRLFLISNPNQTEDRYLPVDG